MWDKVRRKSILRVMGLACGLVFIFSTCKLSADGKLPRQQTFVYGTNHFNGATYSSAMVPPSVDTCYLLAGEINILAGRYTDVYYWPITNEYKADWDGKNIVVDGELEILKGKQLIKTIPHENYVIQYDALNKLDTITMYIGQEAVEAHRNFEAFRDQYRKDLQKYHISLREYREEYRNALKKLQAGEIEEDDLPKKPEPLEDITLFSTDLLVGFPVNLPVGRYLVQLRRPDGSIQRKSRKNLIVFESIREGVGYKVITEERWTVPEMSYDHTDVIYSLRDKVFFLEPYYQKEYNEFFYRRMNNPQNTTARRDRTLWVPFQVIQEGTLLVSGQDSINHMNLQEYHVKQIPEGRLGYEIVPFDSETMESPSFSGFRFDTKNLSRLSQISLQDIDLGLIEYSEREVRLLFAQRSPYVHVISMFPLLMGIVIVLLRRNQVHEVKTKG